MKNFAESVRYSCARWEPREGEGEGRGLNCARRAIYQFPGDSLLLSAEMIPIKGIVVRIFWRRTLTPTEGREGDREGGRGEGERERDREG